MNTYQKISLVTFIISIDFDFFFKQMQSVEPFCEKRTVKIIVEVVEQWLCVMGSSLQSSLKHLSKNVHHIYKKRR